jgi:hypothetical protein
LNEVTTGVTVDDFKIEKVKQILSKVIGRGTFGKVFLVRKKGANTLYAMKVLKKE